MDELTLFGIGLIIPLIVVVVLSCLISRPLKKIVSNTTGSEPAAKFSLRIFVLSMLLAAFICPLANQPCGFGQALNLAGFSLIVILITLAINLFLLYKLIKILNRKAFP